MVRESWVRPPYLVAYLPRMWMLTYKWGGSFLSVHVCQRFAMNPCLAGTCVDTNDGDYSCACAPGYSLGTNADGSAVCRPEDALGLSTVNNQVIVPSGGASCRSVAFSNLLILTQLQMLNPVLADLCTVGGALIPGGTAVIVGPVTGHTDCAILYTIAEVGTHGIQCGLTGSQDATLILSPSVSQGDTFASVSALLSSEGADVVVSVANLQYLNPNLNFTDAQSLPSGQVVSRPPHKHSLFTPPTHPRLSPFVLQMCAEGGNRALQPLCADYMTVQDGDSCASIIADHAILPLAFFFLNPGLDCSRLPTFPGLQVCVAPVGSGSAGSCGKLAPKSFPYTVKMGDTCSGIQGKYFTCSQPIMACYNGGYQCKDPLKIGTTFNAPVSLPKLSGATLYLCNNQRKTRSG